MKHKKIKNIPEDQFRDIIANCTSWRKVFIKMGMGRAKDIYKTAIPVIIKRAEESDIDIKHLVRVNGLKNDLFLRGINGKMGQCRRGPEFLRRELNRIGRPYICEWCQCKNMELNEEGEWMWNGYELKLEINHVMGVDFENCNDADNLQYLCSNCHRQYTALSMLSNDTIDD